MKTTHNKVLYTLSIVMVYLGIIASGIGLFYRTDGVPYDFVNQYGDSIKIYGQGIYCHDSFPMAPVFRGTDCVILFLAIPLFITALTLDWKKQNIKTRMFLISMLALFLYYSASLAFGVTYNPLFLVYLALFSASLFALVVALLSLDMQAVAANVRAELPYRWIYTFLIFIGVALFIAWLPDIIQSWVNHRSLTTIEIYTTAPTYILDMGIVSPVAMICLSTIKRRNGLGFVLLEMLLAICLMIGVILPVQSLFQIQAGIQLPLPMIITKVGTFCILAVLAIPLEYKLIRSIQA